VMRRGIGIRKKVTLRLSKVPRFMWYRAFQPQRSWHNTGTNVSKKRFKRNLERISYTKCGCMKHLTVVQYIPDTFRFHVVPVMW